jgi:hypothetical protein
MPREGTKKTETARRAASVLEPERFAFRLPFGVLTHEKLSRVPSSSSTFA